MKTITTLLLLLVAVSLRGANPSFGDFNTNHFDTTGNKILPKRDAIPRNFGTNIVGPYTNSATTTWWNSQGTHWWTNSANGFAIDGVPQANHKLTVDGGEYIYANQFGTAITSDGAFYTSSSLNFGTVLQMDNAWVLNGSLGNFLIRDATDNPMTNFMFGDYTTNLMFGIWWNSNPPALYLRTISNTLPADFWISGTFYGNGGGLSNLPAGAITAVYASNVYAGGTLSVAAITAGGPITGNGSGLTNLNSTNWTTWSDSIAGYALQANGFNDGLYSGAFLEVGDGVSGNNQGGSAVLNAGDFSTFTGSYIRLAPGTDSPVGGTGSFYGGASSNAYGGNVSVSGATAAAGGDANIEGGSGLGGVASGGNIHLTPGSGIGGGSAGKIYFNSPPIGNGSGLTNLSASSLASGTVPAARLPGDSLTNSASALTPDFSLDANGKTRYAYLTTNNAFAFLNPINVDATKTLAQTTVVIVTNSTASAKAVTAPAAIHTQGTWYVTNVTTFTFFQYGGYWTNAVAFPQW